ncbi:MAG: ABC transporter ATP-binding protein [candidate division WOR-3 bacterium]
MKQQEYKLIIDFWRNNKRRLIYIIVATALGTIVSLSFPYILKLIIDGIKTQLQVRQLLKYVCLLFIFGFLRSTISVFLPFLRGRTNEIFQWLTRTNVFKQILQKGLSFTNKFPSGDVIERLDQDLGELSWFACSGIFRPIEGIFTITFALIILIKLNPLLTLISVLPVSIAVLIWLKLGPIVYKWYRAWREAMSQTSEHIESSFTGIKLIKSYCVEQANRLKFQQILADRIAKAVTVVKAEAKIGIYFSAIAELGILLILWVGGMMVIKQHLTLGDFVAFNGYILMLITPMFDIGNFFVAGRRAKAGEERIRALMEVKPDIEVKTATPIKIAGWQKIEFRNVSFQYPNDNRWVLENINLTILPKTKIGIAGTVGSGKTTLIKLLLRICDPTQGTIFLDNIPYPNIDLTSLRALFGYAPQDTALFSDTIYNNIVWGRDNNHRAQATSLEKLIEITQLAEDLKTFPEKLAQPIGERGLSLSGGQKQKVALARALYHNPDILILDDATSNLDAHTEQALIKNLTMLQNTTCKHLSLLIISHRLTLLSLCDIIYCFDKGKIVEQGTHQELLIKKGLYWKLYQRQLLEKELK